MLENLEVVCIKRLIRSFACSPTDTRRKLKYIRRSEDVLDVFWKSYVRLIYVLCLRGDVWNVKLECKNVTDIFLLIFFNKFRIARGVFTTLSNIYDEAFLQNSYWTPSIVPMLYKTFQKKVVFFMSGVLNGLKNLLLHEIVAILFPCL